MIKLFSVLRESYINLTYPILNLNWAFFIILDVKLLYLLGVVRMDVRSIAKPVADPVAFNNSKPAYSYIETAVKDGFQKGEDFETFDTDRIRFLQAGCAGKSNRKKEFGGVVAGLDVLFGGMVIAGVVSAVSPGLGAFVMLGTLFGALVTATR